MQRSAVKVGGPGLHTRARARTHTHTHTALAALLAVVADGGGGGGEGGGEPVRDGGGYRDPAGKREGGT